MPHRRLWKCSNGRGSHVPSWVERVTLLWAMPLPARKAGRSPSHHSTRAGPEGRLPALLLASAAISTAGDAERFVIIDGHRYSHIINPATGQAVEDRASVTVVAPDGGMADALETTVYILGPERGLKLVEETPGAAAIYVRMTKDGIKTFESSRFKEIQKVTE